MLYQLYDTYAKVSLSARRAWIEIMRRTLLTRFYPVALRKESVDRNLVGCIDRTIDIMSLSARRAWIEIFITQIKIVTGCGRSPQGERG